MRIGIDCRLGGLAHAGIGRYCEQLVFEVCHQSATSDTITWVFFFADKKQIEASPLFTEVVKLPHVEIRFVPIRHYSFAEQLVLPWHFYAAKLHLLHVPHFNLPLLYLRPTVITIHDLLWHQYQGTEVTTLPKAWYWIKYLGYRLISSQAIKRAKRIFVPAETVKNEVLRQYHLSENKLVVTLEGVDISRLTTPPTTLPKKPKHPYLLYVGSLYPHKNVSVALEALKKVISEPDLQLMIVGSRNVFQDQLRARVAELRLEDRVDFAGFVSDSQLGYLYKNALAVLQPSLSEGFGLTGIEAMAVGVPVIASDIKIFRELYQDFALLFDPKSSDELAAAIKKVQSFSVSKRAAVIARARAHTQKFSWQTMAAKTLKMYQSIL